MILSVSRRTDIPNYYSDWFYNRIKEGFLYVRNPMNIHQVSKISLSPEVVDCIVFWTKNPEPMMERLDELRDYKYYFQFTLTGYGNDVEKNIPSKKEYMIPVFIKLSEQIGADKVIWRYDPIFFNKIYTQEYHLKTFEYIASGLKGCTKKCVISFVDMYAKNKRNMDRLGIQNTSDNEIKRFAIQLNNIAHNYGIEIATCAEKIDLSEYGIKHNSCIDQKLVQSIVGYQIQTQKDKNQRQECGCVESVDVGCYNTCKSGCKYCYANYSEKSVLKNNMNYDVNSQLLCSRLMEEDKVTERKVKSLKERQMSIFEL